MNDKQTLKQALSQAKNTACTLFTLIITGSYLIGFFTNKNSVFVPTTKSAMLMLVFSLIAGILGIMISSSRVPRWKYAVHFLLLAVSFYLLFILPSGIATFGGGSMILLVCFFAVYGSAMLVRYVLRKKKADTVGTVSYTSIFDTSDAKLNNRKDAEN